MSEYMRPKIAALPTALVSFFMAVTLQVVVIVCFRVLHA
jgi:hypothetical protein